MNSDFDFDCIQKMVFVVDAWMSYIIYKEA